jgi:hypothetical protein
LVDAPLQAICGNVASHFLIRHCAAFPFSIPLGTENNHGIWASGGCAPQQAHRQIDHELDAHAAELSPNDLRFADRRRYDECFDLDDRDGDASAMVHMVAAYLEEAL